jgi:hypothetical protein
MKDELTERFPKLFLQACELPTGEWIIASPTEPLTQDEAEKVVLARMSRGGDRQPSYSHAMRREGSRRTLRSCPSY